MTQPGPPPHPIPPHTHTHTLPRAAAGRACCCSARASASTPRRSCAACACWAWRRRRRMRCAWPTRAYWAGWQSRSCCRRGWGWWAVAVAGAGARACTASRRAFLFSAGLNGTGQLRNSQRWLHPVPPTKISQKQGALPPPARVQEKEVEGYSLAALCSRHLDPTAAAAAAPAPGAGPLARTRAALIAAVRLGEAGVEAEAASAARAPSFLSCSACSQPPTPPPHPPHSCGPTPPPTPPHPTLQPPPRRRRWACLRLRCNARWQWQACWRTWRQRG